MLDRSDTDPPALFLAFGDDSFQVSAAVDEFARGIGALERTHLLPERSPDEALLDRARVEAASVPLFGGRHLVVLRQPLRAAGRSASALDRLVALATDLPPGAAIAFAEERPSRDAGKVSPALRRLADAVTARGGSVVERNAPRRRELASWIQHHANELGISIEPAAASALGERIGGSTWEGDIERGEQTRAAHSELGKLATYAGDRRIGVRDVEALVADTRPSSVFAITNALERREPAGMAAALDRALAEGQPPLLIMSALHGRLSDLIAARDLLANRATADQLTRRVGRGSPRSAERLTEAARRFTGAELEEMLRGLLVADIEIKTNAVPPEAALSAWLGTHVLARAGRPARAGRAPSSAGEPRERP